MVDIIVGEKVINKVNAVGTIVSVDDKCISVDFATKTAKFLLNAFEQGFLKYENAELQSKVDEIVSQVKMEEARKAEEIKKEQRIVEEKAKEERKLLASKTTRENSDVHFASVNVNLEPAPVNLNCVKKKDRELVQNVFNECDKDIKVLYESFNPQLQYSKITSYARIKYSVGFLCKYLNVYVFRVFSRNDVYRKSESRGVTVMKSDTTEILRVLQIDNQVYTFSKNLANTYAAAQGLKFETITMSYNRWHDSDLGGKVVLNEIIRRCDCAYLNDYIEERNIAYKPYAKLLMPALHSNKAEIVFKNKLFLSTYRIEQLTEYLEQFSPKQIDFASKNDVINTLPIIKRYGYLDMDILQKMESVMKPLPGYHRYSTYEKLIDIFERLHFNIDSLDKKLINFVKKVDPFHSTVYDDYVGQLAYRDGVTVDDFFDKDYVERHNIMLKESEVRHTKEESEQYERIAKELSWIDRFDNGYFIIVPKTINELKREGAIQHNCVYTLKYYQKVINRESIIVFLRKERDMSYVTIEFDCETFEVRQAYGTYNQRIDSSLYNYIVKLGKQLHYEMLSSQ